MHYSPDSNAAGATAAVEPSPLDGPADGERLPSLRPEITLRLLEGEAILFDPRCDATHRLNATAVAIWWLCAGAESVHQVAMRLAEVYDVDVVDAEADVRRVIATISELDLTPSELLAS